MRDDADLIGTPKTKDTPLYRCLFEGLPAHRSERRAGHLDIQKICKDLNVSRQGLHKWFDRQALPGKRVKQLVELDGSTLNRTVLSQYLG